jgi:hypothetical protein
MATGAFILNTGLDKLRANDDEMAKGIHGMARNAYPIVDKTDPKTFVKIVATGEVILGGALLLPIVPAGIAGLGLATFATGLLGVYWRNPGLHRAPNDPRPTQQGTPMAKDLWMLGIGTSLVIDSVLAGAERKRVGAAAAIKGATAAAVTSAGAKATSAGAKTKSLGEVAGARTRAETKALKAQARAKAKGLTEVAGVKAKGLTEVAGEKAKTVSAAAGTKAKELTEVAGEKAQRLTHDVAHNVAHGVKERIA